MEVVGESNPIYPGLVDALKRARAQAQVRPVADRISATESFIERARKGAEKERKGGRKSKGRVGHSRGTINLGRRVFARIRKSPPCSAAGSQWSGSEPTRQSPGRFCSRIGAVEDNGARCVAGARAVEVQAGTRSLAAPSPDLMSISNEPVLGTCRDPSRLMETLIDRADTALRSSWASASEQVVA